MNGSPLGAGEPAGAQAPACFCVQKVGLGIENNKNPN